MNIKPKKLPINDIAYSVTKKGRKIINKYDVYGEPAIPNDDEDIYEVMIKVMKKLTLKEIRERMK